MATVTPFPTPHRRAVPNVVLATVLFLITEVMLFCGLVSGYLVLRSQAGPWPPADQPRLPILTTGFNSVLLIASGFTAWAAVGAMHRSRARAVTLLTSTLALGVAFVLVQGVEWSRLLAFGLTSSSSLYGSLFYTVVGAHALHVVGALVALGCVLGRAAGASTTRTTQVSALSVCSGRSWWSCGRPST